MSRLMSYFNKGENKELVILVATSGDTGGAVASGFYKTPGIKVVILYPSGRVSPLQEKQLTTLGHNISAIEVDGSFDDCQAMVKSAFLDKDLNKSILVFSIPSGNFGNLTAGLLAKRLGLPVHHFIAATNANDIVPQFLSSGEYNPKASVATISNAMDVGNPSNFYRMLSLYMDKVAPVKVERFTWNNMKKDISGFAYSDKTTREAISEIKGKYNYTMDPHGAVGYLALKDYQQTHPNTSGIILETAHPSKFIDEVESTLDIKVDIPERLAKLAELPKEATPMKADFSLLKSFLADNF